MGLTSQIWAGIIQEFRIYKHYPSRLAFFYATVAISLICAIILRLANKPENNEPQEDSRLVVFCETLQGIFLFSPGFLLIFEMAHARESNIESFVIINGMRKLAYKAKVLLKNYFLMLIVVLEQIIEDCLEISTWSSVHSAREITIMFVENLCCYLGGSFAIVNTCFFISRFCRPQQAISISWIFYGLPIILLFVFRNFFFEFDSNILLDPLSVLNPFLRTSMYTDDSRDVSNRIKIFFISTGQGTLLLALGILYEWLLFSFLKIIAILKVQEWINRRKQMNQERRQRTHAELSMILMENKLI